MDSVPVMQCRQEWIQSQACSAGSGGSSSRHAVQAVVDPVPDMQCRQWWIQSQTCSTGSGGSQCNESTDPHLQSHPQDCKIRSGKPSVGLKLKKKSSDLDIFLLINMDCPPLAFCNFPFLFWEILDPPLTVLFFFCPDGHECIPVRCILSSLYGMGGLCPGESP